MGGFSKEFLNELGVEMDDQTFQAFSEHFDDELHSYVLGRIVHQLSDQQVAELGNMEGVSHDVLWQWLQANVPNLGDIVKTEVDAMLAEVVRNSDHL